jgi:hypothetical protein
MNRADLFARIVDNRRAGFGRNGRFGIGLSTCAGERNRRCRTRHYRSEENHFNLLIGAAYGRII